MRHWKVATERLPFTTVSNTVMQGFGAKAAEIISRSREQNLRNLRNAMERTAKEPQRRGRKKTAPVKIDNSYQPYIPSLTRFQIAMAMTIFGQAV